MKKISCAFAVLLFLVSCGADEKSKVRQQVENKIGSKDSTYSESNNMGDWQIDNYLDEFNEKTDKKYIVLKPIKGVLKNSASYEYDLKVVIEADTSHVAIKLFEDGSKYEAELEGNVTFKVKESDGNVHDITTYEGSTFHKGSDVNDSLFRAILSRGGEIKFSATHSLYGNKTNYSFTIPNADHFQDAMNEIANK